MKPNDCRFKFLPINNELLITYDVADNNSDVKKLKKMDKKYGHRLEEMVNYMYGFDMSLTSYMDRRERKSFLARIQKNGKTAKKTGR